MYSLAAAALDAHHVNERVAAHSPVSTWPVQATGRCHEPRLALSNKGACCIPQRRAVPASKTPFCGTAECRPLLRVHYNARFLAVPRQDGVTILAGPECATPAKLVTYKRIGQKSASNLGCKLWRRHVCN